MEFEFELYVDEETGKKMIFISSTSGASGANCSYESIDDIGKIITNYLYNYYFGE